jgi:hypothetical protein
LTQQGVLQSQFSSLEENHSSLSQHLEKAKIDINFKYRALKKWYIAAKAAGIAAHARIC